MKVNHLVALALLAWYLMVPPLVDAPYKIDTEGPTDHLEGVSKI
jgi:hypothetical protein